MRRLLPALLWLAACPGPAELALTVDRGSCLACHRPLEADGSAHGIEQAHPPVDGRNLSCTDCHGGDSSQPKMSDAHVQPGPNAERFLKNLTHGELDVVDIDYLRFINPGDLRVAETSCGPCHTEIIETVKTNQMATFSGELGVARYRAGRQRTHNALKGIYDVRDPTFAVGAIPGTVGALTRMEEPRIQAGETSIGPFQDLYLTKACMRCHLWNFGDNKFQGDYRSSGCTGCHMPYRDDGRSQSDDPMIDKESPPHPEKHRLTNAIPTDQCLHCHYRGARIGPSFKGYRPGAGAGLNPEHADFLGEALHGHDASFYITDEDNRNSVDETPADVHFRAGMDCVDCHTSHDVHGDGHLYNDTNMATEVRCETCHGSADEESDLMTRLGNPMKNLHRDAQGDVWLTTKVKKKRLKVTQISRVIAGAGHDSFLHKSMGRDEDGFSHMDRLSCDACHSGWLPTCYGCHVNVDMRRVQRSLITGVSTPGQISGSRRWVSTDDLILLLSTDGKITPSMPTERMFFTAVDGDGTTVIDKQVRTGPMRNGERLEPNGNGHRAYHPHTVQRWSPFMRCERCHTVPGDAENAERFDQVVGFGTDRYIEVDGNGAGWRLDQVQTRDGEPTVLIGHEGEYKSRPLNLEEIERMRAVEIEVEDCSIPEGVTAPFGIVRDDVFATSCNGSGCHGETDQAADLYLGGNNLHARLTQTESQQTSKPLVVPGSLEDSYLWAKVQDADDIIGGRMPPGQPLNACQLRILSSWILSGASP